jgi:hypothetical protein
MLSGAAYGARSRDVSPPSTAEAFGKPLSALGPKMFRFFVAIVFNFLLV